MLSKTNEKKKENHSKSERYRIFDLIELNWSLIISLFQDFFICRIVCRCGTIKLNQISDRSIHWFFSPFLLSSNLIEWSSSWIKLFRSLWLIYHQTFCWQQLDLIELSVNLSLFCISIALFPFHLNSYDFSRFVTVDWNQSIVEFLTKKNIASLISSIVSS